MYWSLHWSAGVQANFEGVHAISRPISAIFQKVTGDFLSLRLAQVQPKVVMLLVITIIYATSPGWVTQCPSTSRRCNHHAPSMYCVRMILSLGKALSHRESSTSLVCLCLPISSASVGKIMKLVVQIPIMDAILMGYWITCQVRTMMSSVMYNSKLNM